MISESLFETHLYVCVGLVPGGMLPKVPRMYDSYSNIHINTCLTPALLHQVVKWMDLLHLVKSKTNVI